MNRTSILSWLSAYALTGILATSGIGDEPRRGPQPNDLAMSIAKLSGKELESERSRSHFKSAGANELDQVLQLAHAGLRRLDEVNDYTCTLVRRERVNGKLMPEQTIFAKVRHEAGTAEDGRGCLNLYMRFESPSTVQGREILFCNHSQSPSDELKLLVRNGGKRLAFLTAELVPTSVMAMHGNRYPITELGLRRLIERMLLFGEKEKSLSGGKLRVQSHVEFEDDPCTLIEIAHDSSQDGSDYHIARVLIHEALQVPIHFSSYTWPETDSSGDRDPVLVESYTYRDLKLNVDLCDQDFDRNNPEYKFSKR